jgi:hypothetical protein
MATRHSASLDPAALAAQLQDVRRRLRTARALLLTTIDAISPDADHHGDALVHIAALMEEPSEDVAGVASLIAPEAA